MEQFFTDQKYKYTWYWETALVGQLSDFSCSSTAFLPFELLLPSKTKSEICIKPKILNYRLMKFKNRYSVTVFFIPFHAFKTLHFCHKKLLQCCNNLKKACFIFCFLI